MAQKSKPPAGWGELNVALNALVKDGTIHKYGAASGNTGAISIEVTIDAGADQAETVRRVRDVLPLSFAEAQVRTRSA